MADEVQVAGDVVECQVAVPQICRRPRPLQQLCRQVEIERQQLVLQAEALLWVNLQWQHADVSNVLS